MFRELDERSLPETFRLTRQTQAYFFYTPLCGTCKLAQKMCAIAMEALPGTDIYTCNVNVFRDYVEKWRIESIPCLVLARGGIVVEKVYAIASVDKVYQLLQPLSKS